MADNDIAVATLQEITYPIGLESPLQQLAEDAGYNYIEGVQFNYLPNQRVVSIALLTKYPIIDYFTYYFNTPTYSPKNIHEGDFLGPTIYEDHHNRTYPGSRGIKHTAKSRCILSVLINVDRTPVRVITTHFTVSDLCTETPQMYEMSQLIHSLITYSKEQPTIFAADLNIRAESYSVHKLMEVLTCHTAELTDTLSPTHVAKEHDFPEGLAIDHVFSRGLEHTSTEAHIVDFSKHQSVVSEFDLLTT